MYAFQKTRACWLVAAAVVLVACNQAVLNGPSGAITLRYDGGSGSKLFFVLENRTSHPINLPVKGLFWDKETPALSELDCRPTGPQEIYNYFGLDGFHVLGPGLRRLDPEDSVRLEVDWNGRGRDLNCQLRITLEYPEQQIESAMFRPAVYKGPAAVGETPPLVDPLTTALLALMSPIIVIAISVLTAFVAKIKRLEKPPLRRLLSRSLIFGIAGAAISCSATIGWMIWYKHSTGWSAGPGLYVWEIFYGPISVAIGLAIALVRWWKERR